MICAPRNLWNFLWWVHLETSESRIDKPPSGRPKRAELPDVTINTDAQSINAERASLTTGRNVCLWCGPSVCTIPIWIIRTRHPHGDNYTMHKFTYLDPSGLKLSYSTANDTLEVCRVRRDRNLQDIVEHGCCCSSYSNRCSSDNKPYEWLCGFGLKDDRHRANHLHVFCSDFGRDMNQPCVFQMHQRSGTTLSEDPLGRRWLVRPSTNLTWSHHPT